MSEPIDDGLPECPACDGFGTEFVDGDRVLCTNCNGSGFSAAPQPDDNEKE